MPGPSPCFEDSRRAGGASLGPVDRYLPRRQSSTYHYSGDCAEWRSIHKSREFPGLVVSAQFDSSDSQSYAGANGKAE